MGNGIEARFEYGGMILTCDDAALARLYEHICREASVAEVIGRRSEASSVRFISVRPPVDESARPKFRWVEFIPIILVGCIQLVVMTVGVVTIYQWVMRQLA